MIVRAFFTRTRIDSDVPAFFSCIVNLCQSSVILSLSFIHKSACSWGGIPSHRFSILARVGFDIACRESDRCCWILFRQDTAGERRREGRRTGRESREVLLEARGRDRSIVWDDVTFCRMTKLKELKRGEDDQLRSLEPLEPWFGWVTFEIKEYG